MMPEDHTFALCLTHDVDRPYKRAHQAVYYALQDRSVSHLTSLLPGRNPYWQYDEIMDLEASLGVRSAFYFLSEPNRLRERPHGGLLRPDEWVQHLGRYDVRSGDIAELIRTLDEGGWEVGLHGSYRSADDRERLRHEKALIEDVLGRDVVGGRQHYLRLSVPDTWGHHRAIGLEYDASFGSSTEYGFQNGYRPFTPLDDDFLVFPLVLMEQALEEISRFETRKAECRRLLQEAAEHRAVMTVLWHPRSFNEEEFPGYGRLYRWLVEQALAMGAWVGPPAKFRAEMTSNGDFERWCTTESPV